MSTTRVSSLRLTARNSKHLSAHRPVRSFTTVLLGTIEAIPAERKIVLLDRTTVRIVDAVCTLNDILDVGVYLVETVEKRRQPYPTMDAVYFITPERGEDASVTVVSRDFADKLPMYKSVHLFFTNEVSQGLFQMLATSPAGPFVKSFQEMFVDFIPVEARAFHLGMDGSFGRLLRGGADTIPGNMGELEGMANRLVSLIVSLNELPTIRYRATGGAAPDCEGRLSARLANLVQEALDRYVTRNPGFRPVAGGELLIMDRTMDLAAPLLHEFTYQAMAQDLLSIHHENRYDYKFSSGARGELATRTVALDENDSLWVAMRHTHIADCSKLIISRFNQFTSENKAAIKHTAATKQSAEATADANVTSLSELKQTMNALGEFQELKAQVSRTGSGRG